MGKRKRITSYTYMSKPHKEQVRENARRTPEECWDAFLELQRKHYATFGIPEKRAKGITLGKPYWL